MPMGDTLTRKAGPLPVWAWAGLGTAGLAGYMIYRNKKNAAAQASQQGTDSSNLGTTPISDLTTSAQPMPIQMGDTFVTVNDSGDGDGDGDGGKVPKPVPNPQPCPKGERRVGAKCVKNPPVKPKPPTPKPPNPPSPRGKTVTVCAYPSWCGSLWGIAKQEYGNGELWPAIYNANKALIGSNPNLIHVGQVLTIPPKPA